jgi:hypothetical protein
MSYNIRFVDDQEFESLPGKNMYSKVGVAYPEYRQAFVRKSGSNLVDVFTMAHELEHLDGKHLDEHFDSENRCYYKDFGNIWQPALTALGTMFGGPLGGAIGGSVGGGLSSQFGQGPKQPSQQTPQMNPMGMFNPEMTGQGAPNVIQTQGASGQGAQSQVGAGGQKQASLSDMAQQQAGTYAGLAPNTGFQGMVA